MKRVIESFSENEVILNTFYKYEKDSLLVVSKDIRSGNKIMREYPEPRVPVYILSPQYWQKDYMEFAPKEKLDMKWVSYRWREYDLARHLELNDFSKKVRSKETQLNHIHLDRRLFSTDFHIEDLVMKEYFRFCLKENNGDIVIDFPKIDNFHLGGLDIETDINVSDEKEEQPIIANTAIDNKTGKIVTTCLINPAYKGQKEIMDNILEFKLEFKNVLYNHIENIDIDEDDPVRKKKKEDNMKKLIHEMADKLDLELTFTDDEREVIKRPTEFIFKDANPDFCYIYNAVYDIHHIKLRAEKLGMDFDDLFKYKDMEAFNKFNYRSEDPDPKKREHHYNSNNPTKIIDQLLQYAQLRRGKLFASYSLDAVASREIGVSKLDYSKICSYIGDFPYVDFKSFLIYNIIDVFIMLVLDKVTNDCYSQVYSRFNLCTEWGRIAKPMKRTTNVFDTLADIQGFIPGNELNAMFVHLPKTKLDKIKEKNPSLYNIIQQLREANTKNKEDNPYRIEGGCVTDPNKINPSISKHKTYDFDVKNYRKLKNCADLDATAMYPNNIISNNGSKTTLIGIMNKVNGISNDNISQRSALSLLNENYNNIGHHFFNLPYTEDIIRDYYNITPTYRRRVAEIKDYCKTDVIYNPKNKFFDSYRKLLKSLYRTKYDKKDVDAGAPPLSTYFFSNDRNYIRFSYYDTLVTLSLEEGKSFNDLCGFGEIGFICGKPIAKESRIENHNADYIQSMIPVMEMDKIGDIIYETEISNDVLLELSNSKIRPYNLIIGDYKLNALDRLYFWNYAKAKTPLKAKIHNLYGHDNKLVKDSVVLNLSCNYAVTPDVILTVSQYIVLYKG